MKPEATRPNAPPEQLLRSPYAPLNPSGPLPPALNAATVKAAYAEWGGSPSHVLSLLNVRVGASETTAQRLRRTLDQAAHRERLCTVERGKNALHVRLCFYLVNSAHGSGVFRRLIQPAINERDTSKPLLDLELFAQCIETELKEVGELTAPITQRTPEEALAGFALAFGLVQPGDAERILRLLFKLGPAYARYFDATFVEPVPSERTFSPPPAGEAPGTTAAPAPARARPAAPPSAEAEPRSSSENRVPRSIALQQLAQAWDSTRRTRQSLGAAEHLDRSAFLESAEREEAARASFQAREQQLSDELRQLLDEATQLLAPYLEPRLLAPAHETSDALARWLDAAEQQLPELRHQVRELAEKQSLLRQLVPRGDSRPWEREICSSLETAGELLARRTQALGQELQLLSNWKSEREQLRLELGDCVRPAPSASLRKPPAARAITLLRGCRLEPDLEPLLPLALRLLATTDSWATRVPRQEELQLVGELLNASARSRDAEHHATLTSFLDVDTVQNVLRGPNEEVSRHLVLTTFQETLARQHPAFFHQVWPCAGWAQRRACVGDRLTRVFEGLQRLLVTGGGIHPVLMHLSRPWHESTLDAGFEARRRQVAEDLARCLEERTEVTGHFLRLRTIACRTFFRPLVAAVRQRRLHHVQPELLSLERRLREGLLVQEVLEEFGDTRELRRSHHESVGRYIEERLEKLREWVNAESALQRVLEQAEENPLWGEVDPLLQQLRQLAAEPLGAEPGSVEWLEHKVGGLLQQLGENQRPDASLAFFGELPAADTLFHHAHEPRQPPAQGERLEPQRGAVREPWPSWLEGTPRSERLWVRSLHGEATWLDLLQDGLARLLLGRDRSPEQVLHSFFDARELDAALEAAQFPGFREHAGLEPLVQKIRGLSEQSRQLQQELSELEKRQERLQRADLSPQERQELDGLLQTQLEGLEALERLELETGRARALAVRTVLERIERRLQVEADALLERRQEVEGWLMAAGVAPPTDASVSELEKLRKATVERAFARRQHLLRLRELDRQGIPERLRTAVRAFLREADHPSRWPDAASASKADFYVELLIQMSSDWWATLRSLSPAEPAHQRLSRLVELLAERLPLEVDKAATGDTSAPTMLSLLVERASNVEAQYYQLLRQHGLLKDPLPAEPTSSRPSSLERRRSWDRGRAWEQVQMQLELGLEPPPLAPAGDGKLVESAFMAFERGDVTEARELSRKAWAWAKANQRTESLGALLAIHGWTAYQSGAGNTKAAVNALGLLFRHVASFRKGGGMELRLLGWWLDLSGLAPSSTERPALALHLCEALSALANTAVGDPHREDFGVLLRVADPLSLAELLWNAMSGAPRVREGRAALLTLLYELGESDTLSQLFEREGENERYLNAFLTLVSRAAVDPSPKLITAIRQNLRTLDRLKNAPFKDFANRLYQKLNLPEARVQLELLSDTLEPQERADDYRLLIRIIPDESDPPLSLRLHLLESDFRMAEGEEAVRVITDKEAMLDAKEIELPIRPRDRAAARLVILQAEGETASGNPLNVQSRFEVQVSTEERFAPIPVDELLEIYPGYDAKPVSGQAFVGRHEELETLARTLARDNPGAAILYGARRLGKTSLLDELRMRHCVTERPASQTLFIVVPVDTFQAESKSEHTFLERFFRLVRNSVVTGIKNQGFRKLLDAQGVDKQQLMRCGQLDGEFENAPFIARLREFLHRLRTLARGRYTRTVLVMDEFDKLLEAYRKHLRNDVEELINQLRLAATEEPDLGLLLAGSDLMRALLDHYRSAMYGSATVIQLKGFQDLAKARQIIAPAALKGRREFSDPVCHEVIRITGGHPLYMRLVGCTAAYLSRRRRVSIGTIHEAVDKLLRNQVLSGNFPDPLNLVKQPLNALALMETETEERLCRLLLLQLARHISLERPWVRWAVITQDEKMEALRPAATWGRLRDRLMEDARLLVRNDKQLWSFSFPILAAALRVGWEHEFETLYTQLRNAHEAGS